MHLCTRLVCTAFDEIEKQFSRYRSMKQKTIQDIAYTQKCLIICLGLYKPTFPIENRFYCRPIH